MDRPLSFCGRFRLKLHLAIYKLREVYRKQLATLRMSGSMFGKKDSKVHETATLNSETKEKIQKIIEEKR